VDEATLEPIPDALVATSKRNDWTDANGWFDTGDLLDGLDDLLVVNVGENTSTHEVPKSSWTRMRHAWQMPLSIGPTFRLRFGDADVAKPEAWEARLVRESGGGDGWHRLRKGPPPYLRFGVPFPELAAGEHLWLEARSLDGLHEGTGEVTSLVGIHEVEIACRQRAVLRGRVVDESGVPWNEFSIDAVQRAEGVEERLRTLTGIDGAYQLSAGAPGRMRTTFRYPSETRARHLEFDVPRGVTQAPVLVVQRGAVGAIRGLIVSRKSSEPLEGYLRLRALDGSGYERSLSFGRGKVLVIGDGIERLSSSTENRQEFRFEGLPPSRFELSAFSLRGYTCSPAALEVQVPAEGLVFQVENAVRLRRYAFELTDAESGAVLDGVDAAIRLDEVWREWDTKDGLLREIADGAQFEWAATAPGYRAEGGSERDFLLQGDAMVARRALHRGFSLRLELKDLSEGADLWRETGFRGVRWRRRGVAGAEILADGAPVATSDEHGIAQLELPAEPGRIEVRLPGWRVLESSCYRDGVVTCRATAVLPMVRE
jgi:hypothetical protein